MARSITDWMNIMLAEKLTFANLSVYQPDPSSAQDFLDSLTSNSKASLWQLDLWIIATIAAAFDINLDNQLADMEKVAAKSRYGTEPWYVDVAKAFQYGDALVYADLQWNYPVVNPDNQVIKLASAKEGQGRVNLKIATIVSGVLQPLTTLQFNAVQAYFTLKKPSGIRLNIINDNPDDLSLQLIVNYDPLVLTSAGELISSPGTFPVEDARKAYLQALEFDGAFELMSLVNYVQAAKGVKSVYVDSASARYGTNPFQSFTERYYPNAGYLQIHSTSTITYNADV